MDSLKEKVWRIAESNLTDQQYFLVDVVISGKERTGLNIMVVVDGDNGFNIDECAKLSRSVGNQLEEDEVIPDAYMLKVASPGVGEPLAHYRQYVKNVGREVSVKTKDGMILKGVLINANDQSIEIQQSNRVELLKIIERENIDQTRVMVSFK